MGARELKRHGIHYEDGGNLILISSLSFVLILITVILTPFVEMTGEASPQQSACRIYAYAIAAMMQAVLVVMRGWRRSLRIYTSALAPFLIWAILSLIWTQHVDLTSKRLALLAVTYAGIFSAVCDLPYQRTMSILRAVIVTVLVLNFAAVIAVPSIGTHPSGLWRGFMAHKNIAGMFCAFTAIMFVFDAAKISWTARLPVIIGALIFLCLSWSKTALISLPIALAAGGCIGMLGQDKTKHIHILRRSFRIAARVLPIVVIIALLALTIEREIFLSFTDDTTAMTTRGAIWRPMIQFYLDRPFLGSGYGAYWDASDNLIDARAINRIWRNVDQGHNGYLDLLVQVGLPGLALALYAVLAWPLQQLSTMVDCRPHRAALIFAILVFSLIENCSESSLFADDALGNAILLLALAQLHRFRLHSSGMSTVAVPRRRRAETPA